MIILLAASFVFSLAAGDTINEAADDKKLQQQQLAFLDYAQSTFQFVNRQLSDFMDEYEALKRAERRRMALTEIVVGADGQQSVYSGEGSHHRRLNLMDLAQLDEIIENGDSMQEAAKQEKSRRALGSQESVGDNQESDARALLDFAKFSFNHINQQMAAFMNVNQHDARRMMRPGGGKQVFVPQGKKKPPYSPAVKAGGFVFVSGQLGMDRPLHLVSHDVQAQTKQALDNLKNWLVAAGSEVDKILKVTIFLKHIHDYDHVNDVYTQFFKDSSVTELPARAAFEVAALPFEAKVEIEAVALA